VGSPNRNDLPVFSPLPATRLKCNFSRHGLRVELLLESTDRNENSRRLELLSSSLSALQREFGASSTLALERLDDRTQARLATYLAGGIAEQARWPEFVDWFVDTVPRLTDAITAVPALRERWSR
jgi:hypothetical protein